jgi:hypothetical protein
LSQGASRWQPLVSVVWIHRLTHWSLSHAPTTKETIWTQVGHQPPIGYGCCQTAHEDTSSIELEPNNAHSTIRSGHSH